MLPRGYTRDTKNGNDGPCEVLPHGYTRDSKNGNDGPF